MIILNFLYKNFDTIIANFLQRSDKIIDQIQSIFQSKEVKYIIKQVTDNGIGNFAIPFKNKNGLKLNANSNNECYNYYKITYFKRDYPLSYKQLN